MEIIALIPKGWELYTGQKGNRYQTLSSMGKWIESATPALISIVESKKEMTVAEIEEELGYSIKVIK